MRSVCAVALCTTAAPRYGSASRTAQQSDERFASMQSKHCLPFVSGVRWALRTTAAPRYGSGGREYQKAGSACSTPARSVYVRLLAVRLALPYLGAAVVRKAQRPLTASQA